MKLKRVFMSNLEAPRGLRTGGRSVTLCFWQQPDATGSVSEAIPRPVVGPRRVQDVVSLLRLRVGATSAARLKKKKNAFQR